MSSGHKHAPAVHSSSSWVLDDLLRQPQIQQRLNQPVNIDNTYDIPYLAGYSVDGKTVYIDRHLPPQIPLGKTGRVFDPIPFLKGHETLEKAAIDLLGWTYAHSHQAATYYERRLAFQAGMQWQDYDKAYAPYIRTDEHEQLQRVPGNLDITPYGDDLKLLQRMRAAMVASGEQPAQQAGAGAGVLPFGAQEDSEFAKSGSKSENYTDGPA